MPKGAPVWRCVLDMADPHQEALFPESAFSDRSRNAGGYRSSWIPVYTDLFNHAKLHELAELLQPDILPGDAVNYALGTVVRWWGWVFKYAPSGEIDMAKGSALRAMSAACGWVGEPERLLESLVKSGFAESHKRRTKGHENFFLVAHDWQEHAGSYLKARQDAAKRQAEKRARDKQNRNFVLGSSHGDVPVTSQHTGPNRTGPNRTTGTSVSGPIESTNVDSLVCVETSPKTARRARQKPAVEGPSGPHTQGIPEVVVSQLTAEYSDRLSAVEVAAQLDAWKGHKSFDEFPDKLAGGRRWLNMAKTGGTNGTTNSRPIGRGAGGAGAFGGDPESERNQEFGRNATKRSDRVVAARRVRLAALGIDVSNIGRAGAVPQSPEPGGQRPG